MADARDVVIVEGVRTPFAKSGTKLKNIHAAELGRVAVTELLQKTEVPVGEIDEVIIGNTGNPPDAVNISRVVALRAGIPLSVPAHTVHRNCASALESISTAFDKIKSGMADVVVAGGTENMSQMPLIYPKAYTDRVETLSRAKTPVQQMAGLLGLLGAGFHQVKEMATTPPLKKTPFKPIISIMEGLTDPFRGINMGQTAEILAKEFGISREEQDKFALESHQKAIAAQKNGNLKSEIHPVFLPPQFKEFVAEDVGPRDGQSLESLAKLKPFFDKKYGSITVGNACPITDGAAAVLLMSRAKAESLGYKPKITIRSYGFRGLEPERMGLGPVIATPVALKRAGLQLKDMGLIELNEAFAAQVIACMKAFESAKFAEERFGQAQALGSIDPSRLNVNGGAIALGHPVGATGTRLVVTLMKEMLRRSDVEFGLATLCIGGGQGGAMILQKES
jgi:acetyl-CoA acyltransferase